jgi:hypothetical protein
MDNGYPEHASDYFKLPYVIGQEVVVREAWQIRAWDCQGYIAIKYKDGSVKRMDTGLFPDDENRETNLYIKLSDYLEDIGCEKNEEGDFINFELPWQSAATMPVSAARTRFIPVSCEAVRVREIEYDEAKLICNPLDYKEYAIHKLGQTAWDNNDYIFYYKIEKI